MIPYYNYYFWTPWLPPNCDKPPTLYAVLNSIVNGDKEDEDEYEKIKDLPRLGRNKIFNFDYPLSTNVSRETFETTILKHFLMRRIGYETVTAFRLALDAKLNEIMPLYNKMFDGLQNWSIFNDGETMTRTGGDSTATHNVLENYSTTTTADTSDRRSSDTPQSQLQNVQDGSYVTNYSYDTSSATGSDNSTSTGNSTNNKTYNETITKTPSNKIKILMEMQKDVQSIYTLIFKDLDDLFYGLI